jgi:hypothetical protein
VAGIDAIQRMREEILVRRGGQPLEVDVASLIDDMRSERDEELFGVLPESFYTVGVEGRIG